MTLARKKCEVQRGDEAKQRESSVISKLLFLHESKEGEGQKTLDWGAHYWSSLMCDAAESLETSKEKAAGVT